MTILKKDRKTLFVGINSVSNVELPASKEELKQRIRTHFRNHIGKEEATNPVEIFASVYFSDPYDFPIYERKYWWNHLQKLMRHMKKELNPVFIVHESSKYYVLKTEEEKDKFKNKLSKTIQNLENTKEQADDWVKKKKWRDI